MADGDGEFSFFRGIHVRIDMIIDIHKTMTTKFSKQVHLKELTRMNLIKVKITSSGQDHVTN